MIVLDASVLIAALAVTDPHTSRATEILATGEDLGIHPVTLGESLVRPARIGREVIAAAQVDRLGVLRIDGGPAEPVELARLRVRTSLRMPDCCVLVAAQQVSGTVATFDERLAAAARDLGLEVVGA